jgi:hypothetical protein
MEFCIQKSCLKVVLQLLYDQNHPKQHFFHTIINLVAFRARKQPFGRFGYYLLAVA